MVIAPRALALISLAALTACTTTPTPSPQTRARPSSIPELEHSALQHNREELLSADGIYLLSARNTQGPRSLVPTLQIVDIWRHDPKLGPAPVPESVWEHGTGHRIALHEAEAFIGLVRKKSDDSVPGYFALPIVNGRVAFLDLPADSVRSMVLEATARTPSGNRPRIEQYIERASRIYLVERDQAATDVLAAIADVLRDKTGAAALSPGHEVPSPDLQGFREAVVFEFDTPIQVDGSDFTRITLPVIYDSVAPGVTVDQLRERVKATDGAPALPDQPLSDR